MAAGKGTAKVGTALEKLEAERDVIRDKREALRAQLLELGQEQRVLDVRIAAEVARAGDEAALEDLRSRPDKVQAALAAQNIGATMADQSRALPFLELAQELAG